MACHSAFCSFSLAIRPLIPGKHRPLWPWGLCPGHFGCLDCFSHYPPTNFCVPLRSQTSLVIPSEKCCCCFFLTSRKYICPALVSYSSMFLSTHHYLHLCIYLGGYLLNACLPRYSLLPRDEAHPERFRAPIPNLFGTRNRWFLRESNA